MTQTRARKAFWRIVIATILITVVAGVALFVQCTRTAVQAERTLHANELVLRVLTAYVETTDGDWPTSWDDLVQTVPAESRSMWKWPDDLAALKQRVRINFDVTTDEVLKMKPGHFTAVEQIGPNYGPSEAAILDLQDVIRSCRNKRNVPLR